MKSIIYLEFLLVILFVTSLFSPQSVKAQCSDPSFSNPICAPNSQPQTNCQNLGVNSFCNGNQVVLFCCSGTSFITPTPIPGGNCQTAPNVYPVCGLAMQPNINCLNNGPSSTCGGSVSGLVMWCCSSPNFVTPTTAPIIPGSCPNKLYPNPICSSAQPNPDCENRGQNPQCGGSASGQNLWCCLTTNILPPAPCPTSAPYPYCGQNSPSAYCQKIGKVDFCGGNGSQNSLFCCTTPTTGFATVSQQKIFCDPSGNATVDPATGRLFTAIGCIPISTINGVLSFMIPWFIGIAGGIALLLIIYAGFMITTSRGDRQKLQAGKELLTATISGLILLIFAILVLRILGQNVLNIPNL